MKVIFSSSYLSLNKLDIYENKVNNKQLSSKEYVIF